VFQKGLETKALDLAALSDEPAVSQPSYASPWKIARLWGALPGRKKQIPPKDAKS
jgi:hypothetical protein